MVTYWLTGIPCPECGKTFKTKAPLYPLEEDIENFNRRLDEIKTRIKDELGNEPSNGWPSPDHDSSWRIGLVKIRVGKKRYEMKCFLCDYSIGEKELKKLNKVKPPLDNYF